MQRTTGLLVCLWLLLCCSWFGSSGKSDNPCNGKSSQLQHASTHTAHAPSESIRNRILTQQQMCISDAHTHQTPSSPPTTSTQHGAFLNCGAETLSTSRHKL